MIAGQPRHYEFHDRRILRVAERMTDDTFRKVYRMNRRNFNRLAEILSPHLLPGNSLNGRSLLPEERILVFLWFAGTGSTNIHSSISHNISKTSIHNAIYQVIDALYTILKPQFLVLPTIEEQRREADLFHQRSGFRFPPIAYGAIDGTHVLVSLRFLLWMYRMFKIKMDSKIYFHWIFREGLHKPVE